MAGLPDVCQDFTTELGLVGLSSGHDSLTGADDNEAESTEHPGDLGLARIHAQSGLANALESGDDRSLAINVFERYAQYLVDAIAFLPDFGDEALLHEDSGDLSLGPRGRNDDIGMPGPRRIADASQHVRNRIGDIHTLPTSSTW